VRVRAEVTDSIEDVRVKAFAPEVADSIEDVRVRAFAPEVMDSIEGAWVGAFPLDSVIDANGGVRVRAAGEMCILGGLD